jgi:hypothetical protein
MLCSHLRASIWLPLRRTLQRPVVWSAGTIEKKIAIKP